MVHSLNSSTIPLARELLACGKSAADMIYWFAAKMIKVTIIQYSNIDKQINREAKTIGNRGYDSKSKFNVEGYKEATFRLPYVKDRLLRSRVQILE